MCFGKFCGVSRVLFLFMMWDPFEIMSGRHFEGRFSKSRLQSLEQGSPQSFRNPQISSGPFMSPKGLGFRVLGLGFFEKPP